MLRGFRLNSAAGSLDIRRNVIDLRIITPHIPRADQAVFVNGMEGIKDPPNCAYPVVAPGVP